MIANGRIMEPKLKSMEGYLYLFKGDRMPIGYDEIMGKFKQTVIDVNVGDQLFLFSDGYADQFGGPRGKKFRISPFRELLQSVSLLPLDSQKNILRQELEKWQGHYEQIDDILVMGIRLE